MKVGYQGIKGAYSESAIYKHFGNSAEAIGFGISEEVFEAVATGEVDFGLLPFENTIAGSVAPNYDLLLQNEVKVIAEVFLRINHCLLSNKGAAMKDIKTVYSHHHALEQCRKFIQKNKFRAIPEYDTAGAAKIVKERNRIDEAAISSEYCAQIYGLEILEKNIQAINNNTTKFLVFVKSGKAPEKLKKEKTSIAFRIRHIPGALITCLQRVAKHNINLTMLQSRPIPDDPWDCIFYADLDGGIDDENVALALSEMEASSLFLKVLGSYPQGKP